MGGRLKHIAVCGNIGSGKTTLTEKLATHYGWHPLYESLDKNPYLEAFYQDMRRWAFNLQVYFLNSRFRQIRKIEDLHLPAIQDRTIYEDAYVFAAHLHKSGFIQDRDYAFYLHIFQSMAGFINPPDLMIYLKADVPKLMEQIIKRGRTYEKGISIDYLQNLNKRYEDWTARYEEGPTITLDMNALNFVESHDDFRFIIEKIEVALGTHFPSFS